MVRNQNEMDGASEIFDRLREVEVIQARHDERLKSVEDLVREVKQIKLAAIGTTLAVVAELIMKLWK